MHTENTASNIFTAINTTLNDFKYNLIDTLSGQKYLHTFQLCHMAEIYMPLKLLLLKKTSNFLITTIIIHICNLFCLFCVNMLVYRKCPLELPSTSIYMESVPITLIQSGQTNNNRVLII